MASTLFSLLCLSSLFFSLAHSSLLLPLSHSLSFHNATAHGLLKSTAARSRARFRRQVSLPLSPGADYTISFSFGSQMVSLYMDTGSDVVWLPCRPFECILCEGKYSPSAVPHSAPLNLTSAAAVHCKSAACSAVHSSLPSSDLCAIAKCPLESIEISDCKSFHCPPFYYAYGDGSFVGKLYQDTLSIPKAAPPLELPKFTFGCANSALAEPVGVAGFGRGALSLPAQIAAASPDIGNYFSYCLISHSFDKLQARRPSPLILGRYEKEMKNDVTETQEFVYYTYTPMLDNPKHKYFYCVGLEGVSIGKRRIPAPASLQRVDRRGNGGMVVDSGTTFTMLPRRFYKAVVGEFDRRVGAVYRRARAVEDRTGLGPCYYGKEENEKLAAKVPKLVFHFGGNASVEMPRRNYFHEFLDSDRKLKVGCMVVMDGGDEAESGGGPAGLLGNYQQQGFEVVYDLEAKRVGFARRKCASLWDRLS
ncbi:probable aspartyl protease At4g16563 [Andrographis paniculata]|uniref:probable aspartyl protease At4g16563 n=1 Tax=Andrographis paniculata TaxID=175694 RepID=UPI0021E78E86|nr:probable aspartyl protease At4g16563 [Andrographis paniculata]